MINDVNDELAEEGETAASQWGKKEAAETEGSAPKGNKSDGKDWHASPPPRRAARARARVAGGSHPAAGGHGGCRDCPRGACCGGADDARTKTTRAIKGILNKITPRSSIV